MVSLQGNGKNRRWLSVARSASLAQRRSLVESGATGFRNACATNQAVVDFPGFNEGHSEGRSEDHSEGRARGSGRSMSSGL